LAGNFADRDGVFTGLWVHLDGERFAASQQCRATTTTVDGLPGLVHGPVSIRFWSPSFPSGFVMAREYCEGPTDPNGRELQYTMTFHYFEPVTNAAPTGPEVDTGFNDPTPGANQEQECLARMAEFSSARDFYDLDRGRNRAQDSWIISGTVVYASGYEREFQCRHAQGRVERVTFGQGRR